jgi:chromosome segregation ATPase
MKKLILFFALALYLVSCNNKEKEPNPLADSLANVNKQLANQLVTKDSTMMLFMSSFNEIQDNLDSIKTKEKLIINSSRGEDAVNKKDQIKADIQAIYSMMAKSRGNLAYLSSKLKAAVKEKLQADSTIAEMQKMVEKLNQQLTEKDGEIAALKAELEKLKIDYSTLTANFKSKEEESNLRQAELNTAYYLVATEKELTEKGIIAKSGGFIGLGKSTKVVNNFRRDNFTKIDITSTSSISIQAKKAEILTIHPEGSFSMDGDKNSVNQITISNAKNFWSSSKYLVIKVKK